jgi:hypothetical protein
VALSKIGLEPVMLDGSVLKAESKDVDSAAIRVAGKLHKTPWERFARLQRSAARLSKGKGQPKGIFCFVSNEACSRWTANLIRSAK